jgi:hypothetical protein
MKTPRSSRRFFYGTADEFRQKKQEQINRRLTPMDADERGFRLAWTGGTLVPDYKSPDPIHSP